MVLAWRNKRVDYRCP